MDAFISEDDLHTLEGYLKYQGVDASISTPEELTEWRKIFAEATHRRMTSPKIGLMKLQQVPREQKYAVAIKDESSDLWLTLWVRCSRKGEVFIMMPRGDRNWDAHASYHLDGTFHQKGYGVKLGVPQKRQPLTAAFQGSESLGCYAGHGTKSIGAVCDPAAFTGLVSVEPGILGPRHGSVEIDLVEPGREPEPTERRHIFTRGDRPSVVITVI
jgi:hypothetical protein